MDLKFGNPEKYRQTDRKSSNSTELYALLGPLPKNRKIERKKEKRKKERKKKAF